MDASNVSRDRRDHLANLLPLLPQNRPPAVDAAIPRERPRWIDVDAEDDGDGDPEAGLPLARTLGPSTRPLTWKEPLGALRHAMVATRQDTAPDWSPGREVLYVVGSGATIAQGASTSRCSPAIRASAAASRCPAGSASGTRGSPRSRRRRTAGSSRCSAGTRDPVASGSTRPPSYGAVAIATSSRLDLHDSVLPILAAGRASLARPPTARTSMNLRWDNGPASPRRSTCAPIRERVYVVTGSLARRRAGAAVLGAAAPRGGPGLQRESGRAARRRRHVPVARPSPAARVAPRPAGAGPRVPRRDPEASRQAPLALPDELKYEDVAVPPRPRLRVHAAPSHSGSQRLRPALASTTTGPSSAGSRQRGRLPGGSRRYLRRERPPSGGPRPASGAGLRRSDRVREPPRRGKAFDLAARDLARAVGKLVEEGWHVEAEGKLYRPPGAFKIEVSSGIDWFELHGEVDFGVTVAQLPALLAALRAARARSCSATAPRHAARGVARRSYGLLAGLGTPDGRPRPLLAQPGRPARRAPRGPARGERRRDLRARPRGAAHRSRASRRATRPPASRGAARLPARRASAGSSSCERFGFGGCLADDMGLGKTVQVLALLESRRAAREPRRERQPARPSLVVVPRSLVFNWKQEAARFTPELRVLDHTGAGRGRAGCALRRVRPRPHDLRHAAPRRARPEGHAASTTSILDEAQAIKNASTESREGGAAAARPTTAWRSPARRSRTTSASCGASSSS